MINTLKIRNFIEKNLNESVNQIEMFNLKKIKLMKSNAEKISKDIEQIDLINKNCLVDTKYSSSMGFNESVYELCLDLFRHKKDKVMLKFLIEINIKKFEDIKQILCVQISDNEGYESIKNKLIEEINELEKKPVLLPIDFIEQKRKELIVINSEISYCNDLIKKYQNLLDEIKDLSKN